MSLIAAIGARVAVQGFGLAGALVVVAEDPDAVRDAWRTLPADVALAVLTSDARAALGDSVDTATMPLVAVMP
jgi:vacuolar-type H+-ATPase subunit F/Vma7